MLFFRWALCEIFRDNAFVLLSDACIRQSLDRQQSSPLSDNGRKPLLKGFFGLVLCLVDLKLLSVEGLAKK